jgi:hypothetical protein
MSDATHCLMAATAAAVLGTGLGAVVCLWTWRCCDFPDEHEHDR